jgi:hypothetical protein
MRTRNQTLGRNCEVVSATAVLTRVAAWLAVPEKLLIFELAVVVRDLPRRFLLGAFGLRHPHP